MSNIDKQALRERYSPKPVPECHICGAQMTIQRISASRITYGCTGATYDDKGCHYAEDRSIADDHYEQSRVTVVDVSDPDVLTLLDELERNQQYIKRRDQENEEIALTVGKLRVELEAEKQRAKDLFMENARLKSGIAGLIHLGIRYADVEVMKIAGDAQLSTPCTDSIINSIATGIRIKGE
ncbi:ead/Ea22-like family protein [Salmonella enterica subsp. enterica]|nr:ead/Ea22-like family protein [Salmonella enterica]ECE7863345.1 ead/Ea22-like family protein [Salmonella enterica subsp. enterica serovar Teko]ECF6757272.1 ead/Ea22-like family protein [Salmonella enterica subsp. enterica serovar Teko]EDV4441979.1 ead/Ea22-like family protein [Salmonella enterica subsp. enterica serovar Teko]ELF8404342.1 ead/Ea22-like family protein [Salmonella enterica]